MRPAPSGISRRNVVVPMAATDSDDDEEKKSEQDNTMSNASTDIQVPKFDSSDFEETDSGPKLDWFSM